MKVYENVKIPSRVEKKLVSRKCDLCGKIGADSWGGGCYEVLETEMTVTIIQKEGNSYPEGGTGTEYEIDLCPDCFKSRLVPWLISQGANIQENEWDW